MSGARDSVGREARSEAFALFSDLSEVASVKAQAVQESCPGGGQEPGGAAGGTWLSAGDQPANTGEDGPAGRAG